MSLLRSHRFFFLNGVLLVTAAAGHWGRRIEAATPPARNLLEAVRPAYHGWETRDEALAPSEETLLRPDATLIRSFRSPRGEEVQLAVVAGHRKQSIHTPAFCMTGGGWELLSQNVEGLSLPDRQVPVVRSLMLRKGYRLLVTYFFTDGEYSTPSLLRFQGMQLLKRFEARVPLGALVRVTVPVRSDEAAARKLADDFSRETIPPILQSLREARLAVP